MSGFEEILTGTTINTGRDEKVLSLTDIRVKHDVFCIEIRDPTGETRYFNALKTNGQIISQAL